MTSSTRPGPWLPPKSALAGFRFPPEVIVVAMRWYLRYCLSYRDVEELLVERGVEVHHVTVYRWAQRSTRCWPTPASTCTHWPGDRWFVDETYVKVNGVWRYVYRAVDQYGQVIDVLVSARRDAGAAALEVWPAATLCRFCGECGRSEEERRVRGVGAVRIAFGLAIALSVAVGCGRPGEVRKDPVAGVSSAPSASPSPTISAAQALTAAAGKLNEQTLSVGVVTGGEMVVHGDVDPVARKARMIVSVIGSRPTIGMELVLTDGVMYAKVAQMPGVPYRWMRLDGKALSGTHLDVLPGKDPAGASQLLAGLVWAERDGSGGFRGTLDLTNGPTAAAYRLKGLGDKAKAVPFTARVNDQGQLTLLDIDLEAVVPGASNIKAQYSGFGQPISVTPPPAAETIDAPADVVARLKA